MANLKVSESYQRNFDALTASTKGAAPGIHIMWSAIALTIFEAIESWVKPDSVKRMDK